MKKENKEGRSEELEDDLNFIDISKIVENENEKEKNEEKVFDLDFIYISKIID